MKKGEISGQIFIYLLSLILVGMILVFGFKAIKSFSTSAEEVVKINFVSDFDSLLNRMEYMDSEVKTFSIPSKYRFVCFVSTEKPGANLEQFTINPLVRDAWEQTTNNVFLVSGIDNFYAFKTKPMRLDTNANGVEDLDEKQFSYICAPASEKITLRLEGKGKYVFVSQKVSN